jgi:hypothetical protein
MCTLLSCFGTRLPLDEVASSIASPMHSSASAEEARTDRITQACRRIPAKWRKKQLSLSLSLSENSKEEMAATDKRLFSPYRVERAMVFEAFF